MSNGNTRLGSTDLKKPTDLESQLSLRRSVGGKNMYLILSFVLTIRDDSCKAISTSTDI